MVFYVNEYVFGYSITKRSYNERYTRYPLSHGPFKEYKEALNWTEKYLQKDLYSKQVKTGRF